MGWFRTISDALRYEPELWMAYRLSQKPHERVLSASSKPRYTGFPLRLMAFGRVLFRTIRSRPTSGNDRHVDVFVLALTENQAASLNSTIVQLRGEGLSVKVVTGQSALNKLSASASDDLDWIRLSLADAAKVLIFTIIRLPVIWRQLAGKDRRLRQWYFDTFLRCHIYLVYFDKALRLSNPRLILMSNDHNPPQRGLLALARAKGVKTAYMQHASVLPSFPALVFDYSLLDGQVAMKNYMDCESNKPISAPVPDRRRIFLTGQKKSVRRAQSMSGNTVGLAINALDDIQEVIAIATAIIYAGYNLRLRWHPAMVGTKAEEICEAFQSLSSVGFSDPVAEPVGDFLAQLRVLVAANSSIHLEAAIAGVFPVYFEMSAVKNRDRFGYIKNSVSVQAEDKRTLLHLIGDILAGHKKVDIFAVQAYSATFQTEWDGREGELAAGIIKDLLIGVDPSQCWGYAGELGAEARH